METTEYKGKTYKVRHTCNKSGACHLCCFRPEYLCPDCGQFKKQDKRGEITRFAYFLPVRKHRERPDLVVALVALAVIFLLVLLASFTIPAL